MRNRHAFILLVASILLLVLAIPALKEPNPNSVPANAAKGVLLDASRDGTIGSQHTNG
jgi:hypothetical protein